VEREEVIRKKDTTNRGRGKEGRRQINERKENNTEINCEKGTNTKGEKERYVKEKERNQDKKEVKDKACQDRKRNK
jgi:hypothetical protein